MINDPIIQAQYGMKWLPESGGKCVMLGDWDLVVQCAKWCMENGAMKIEIERVIEIPNK